MFYITKPLHNTYAYAHHIVNLNMDTILNRNHSFGANASPLLFDFIYEIAKSIKQTATETIFDRWFKNEANWDRTAPRLFFNFRI